MNIYLVEQDVNNGYDTFDSFVCFAENDDVARRMPPNPLILGNERRLEGEWTMDLTRVKVTLLGVAVHDEGAKVVLASFNAG